MAPLVVRTLITTSVAFASLSACSSESTTTSSYTSASCNACAGKSYSAADCDEWGRTASCETSTFKPTVEGCTNGCSFTNCKTAVICGGTQDAGNGVDAASDPQCASALSNPNGSGFFSSKPTLCADRHESNINGSTVWTCPCGACPCGFECGSIKLKVGGFVSSVCAPPAK